VTHVPLDDSCVPDARPGVGLSSAEQEEGGQDALSWESAVPSCSGIGWTMAGGWGGVIGWMWTAASRVTSGGTWERIGILDFESQETKSKMSCSERINLYTSS
jgi:hypothetical protein